MCAFLNHSFSHAFAVSLLLVPAGIASAWQVSSPPPPPQSSPSPAPASQPAGTNVSDVSVFYDQLSPYGEWIKSDKYGWVWHPNDMTPGWRPYTLGRWEYSDDCGWLWTSDEPWGWACFHYGRWAWIDDDGWCWTPGTVWGPAWVAWRSGGDCVGWCALPPEVGWRAGVGLDFGSVSLGFEFGRPWCFCDEHNFCDRDIHEHIFVEARNRTMFERTREISRVTEINGRVFDTSVSVEHIERVSGRSVDRVHIREVTDVRDLHQPSANDREITVFNNRLAENPGAEPPDHDRAPALTGDELRQRQEQQMRDMQTWHETERQQLAQEQQRELDNPPAGMTREQLIHQQELERRDLEVEHNSQIETQRHVHQRENDRDRERIDRTREREQRPGHHRDH